MAREDEPQAGIIYKEAQSIMVDELPELWLWEKFYPIANSDGLVIFSVLRATIVSR